MAVERRDPLPPGRYWIYVLEDELEDWDEWSREHSATVRVVASERKKKLSPFVPAIFVTRPDLSIIMEEAGAWFLFDVTAPTAWVGFGFPTIVTDMTIIRSEQVEQAPDPLPDDQLAKDIWGELKGLVLLAGGIYLAGAFFMRGRR
jgi:hypothetical protein